MIYWWFQVTHDDCRLISSISMIADWFHVIFGLISGLISRDLTDFLWLLIFGGFPIDFAWFVVIADWFRVISDDWPWFHIDFWWLSKCRLISDDFNMIFVIDDWFMEIDDWYRLIFDDWRLKIGDWNPNSLWFNDLTAVYHISDN